MLKLVVGQFGKRASAAFISMSHQRRKDIKNINIVILILLQPIGRP